MHKKILATALLTFALMTSQAVSAATITCTYGAGSNLDNWTTSFRWGDTASGHAAAAACSGSGGAWVLARSFRDLFWL